LIKIVKNPRNGRLNNLNDLVLNVLSQAVGEIKFRNAAQGQIGNNKLCDTSIGAVTEIPWN
jgi:hypothetical protein